MRGIHNSQQYLQALNQAQALSQLAAEAAKKQDPGKTRANAAEDIEKLKQKQESTLRKDTSNRNNKEKSSKSRPARYGQDGSFQEETAPKEAETSAENRRIDLKA